MITKKQLDILISAALILFGCYFAYDFYNKYTDEVYTELATDTVTFQTHTSDGVSIEVTMILDFTETIERGDYYQDTDYIFQSDDELEVSRFKEQHKRILRHNTHESVSEVTAITLFEMKQDIINELSGAGDGEYVIRDFQLAFEENIMRQLETN